MARVSTRPEQVAHPATKNGTSEDAVARQRYAPEWKVVHIEYEGGGRVHVTPLVAKMAVERGEAKYI